MKLRKFKLKIPFNKLIMKVTSLVVQFLLILGLFAVILSTIFSIIYSLNQGLLAVASVTLENALLIVVFLEIYLSVFDFFEGKGRSIVYVLDATMSFISREIIIDVLTANINYVNIIYLGGVIGIIAFSRFIITRKKSRSTEKHN
ncbi:phosphate-starvation-inducible PsiE family protein [Acidianus brierleyi]|uniref:Phosphate-starvation-inducible E-like protein n=1 Tax=Acidianus brierleyi TaxID=41673 RepID=A0A2U9IE45_9CREN|nr:phosphate-starvation-inducible PsiE family protein [Acidianus brierleyi]AWR94318.1 hypothetical protein DFR85_06635 [Acidianus brierleyi]